MYVGMRADIIRPYSCDALRLKVLYRAATEQ